MESMDTSKLNINCDEGEQLVYMAFTGWEVGFCFNRAREHDDFLFSHIPASAKTFIDLKDSVEAVHWEG